MTDKIIAEFIIIIVSWLILFISICMLIYTLFICVNYGIRIHCSVLLIKNIEDKYSSKIIFVKDIETKFINRILMLIYKNTVISINDNNYLRKILQNNNNKKIMFLIKSTGGYISASDSMLKLLESHKPSKTAYVPNYAMSAATLLTLACNKIYMNKYAALGPTDPQITVLNENISYRTLDKLVKNKSIDKIKDIVLFNYYENKKLYDDNIECVKKHIMKHKKNNVTKDIIDDFINNLTIGDIPHHMEFTSNELNKVININYDIPSEILKIYNDINYIFSI